MIGLSKFPRNFNPWTPKAKPPFSLFFVRVNRFLEDPKRLDFSKKENVKHFNDGLTKAIHKDIDDAKIKFLGFRDKLELVETAFESLDKAYYFLDDFDKFAEDCLSKSFQWTEFEDYVKDLTKTITYFQKMKTTNYSSGETPLRLEWPDMEEEDVSVSLEDIGRNIRISIKTGPTIKPTSDMAKRTRENFHQAIRIYEKLIDKCLNQQYQKVMVWLSRTMCWMQIKNEYQAAYDNLIAEIQKEKEAILPKKEKFYALLRTHPPEDKGLDLMTWAKKSVEAATGALSNYYSLEEAHQHIMLETVTKAYRHALDLLQSFIPLVTTEKWTLTTEFAESTRYEASGYVFRWRDRMEKEIDIKLLHAKALITVLTELPAIYTCIAQFTFDYHCPY